jgi:hypothetical protein
MYSWSSTRYCSDDTCCSYHGFTLCNGKITRIKTTGTTKKSILLRSDVKQELNNIIDNFTTNFMDITYNEVVAFLEIVRPGGERLVDQLMISEELSGKDLRTIAREYISNLNNLEVLYNSRQSLFDLITRS